MEGKTGKQSYQIAVVGLAHNLGTQEWVLLFDSCLELRIEIKVCMVDSPALPKFGKAKNMHVSHGLPSGRYP